MAVFGRSGDSATATASPTENGQKDSKEKETEKDAPQSRVRQSRRPKSSDGPTVIAAGTEIEGDVRSEGPVHVEGRVKGAIRSEGIVQVNSAGEVEGDIDSVEVVLAGEVKGNVAAEKRVRMQDGCRVSGDIRAERIQIDEGASMEGHLQMGAASKGTPSK